VLGREITEALAEFEIPILRAGTMQRVVYAKALTAGATVIEANGPVAGEVRAILAEIRETVTA
jgi:hypothetical protein